MNPPLPARRRLVPAPPGGRAGLRVAGYTWLATVAVLALASFAAAVDQTVAATGPRHLGWWALLVAVSAQAATVAWARHAPRLVVPLVGGIALLVVWCGPGAAFSATSVPMLVVVYRAASGGAATKQRSQIGVGGVLFAAAYTAHNMLAASSFGFWAAVGAALAQTVLIVGAPLLCAWMVVTRREIRRSEQRAALAIQERRDALVQAAMARQRTQMARELHDIAAHHLSGLALMAAALDRQIDTDPKAAKGAARRMHQQTSSVLDDLRRLVGLLRDGGDEDAVETLEGVRDLIARAAPEGDPVELQVLPESETPGVGLGPAAGLTAYRMVQESLSNARIHAPGTRRSVVIDQRAAETIVITVRNEAPLDLTPSGREGFGLIGMRERADLVGGDLRYGPEVDGGWMVRLQLPRDPEPMP